MVRRAATSTDPRLSRKRTADMLKALRGINQEARTLRDQVDTAADDNQERDRNRVQPERSRSRG